MLFTKKSSLKCIARNYSNFHADILKIDGLWEFVNLTKLQLDNNIIEKIEGIDMLVNLVWLGKFMYATVNTKKCACKLFLDIKCLKTHNTELLFFSNKTGRYKVWVTDKELF